MDKSFNIPMMSFHKTVRKNQRFFSGESKSSQDRSLSDVFESSGNKSWLENQISSTPAKCGCGEETDDSKEGRKKKKKSKKKRRKEESLEDTRVSSTQDETNFQGSLALECEAIQNEDQEQVTKKKKKSKKKHKEKDKKAQETETPSISSTKEDVNLHGSLIVECEPIEDEYQAQASQKKKSKKKSKKENKISQEQSHEQQDAASHEADDTKSSNNFSATSDFILKCESEEPENQVRKHKHKKKKHKQRDNKEKEDTEISNEDKQRSEEESDAFMAFSPLRVTSTYSDRDKIKPKRHSTFVNLELDVPTSQSEADGSLDTSQEVTESNSSRTKKKRRKRRRESIDQRKEPDSELQPPLVSSGKISPPKTKRRKASHSEDEPGTFQIVIRNQVHHVTAPISRVTGTPSVGRDSYKGIKPPESNDYVADSESEMAADSENKKHDLSLDLTGVQMAVHIVPDARDAAEETEAKPDNMDEDSSDSDDYIVPYQEKQEHSQQEDTADMQEDTCLISNSGGQICKEGKEEQEYSSYGEIDYTDIAVVNNENTPCDEWVDESFYNGPQEDKLLKASSSDEGGFDYDSDGRTSPVIPQIEISRSPSTKKARTKSKKKGKTIQTAEFLAHGSDQERYVQSGNDSFLSNEQSPAKHKAKSTSRRKKKLTGSSDKQTNSSMEETAQQDGNSSQLNHKSHKKRKKEQYVSPDRGADDSMHVLNVQNVETGTSESPTKSGENRKSPKKGKKHKSFSEARMENDEENAGESEIPTSSQATPKHTSDRQKTDENTKSKKKHRKDKDDNSKSKKQHKKDEAQQQASAGGSGSGSGSGSGVSESQNDSQDADRSVNFDDTENEAELSQDLRDWVERRRRRKRDPSYWKDCWLKVFEDQRDVTNPKMGRWSKDELKTLRDNWNRFFEDHPHPEPYKVLCPGKKRGRREQLAFTKENNFYLRLGDNINRPLFMIYNRARVVFHEKSGPMTGEENDALLELYELYPGDWKIIAEEMGRPVDVVRHRYTKLNSVKGKFSNAEKETLFRVISRLKEEEPYTEEHLPWKDICAYLPGRTQNAVRQQWLVCMNGGRNMDSALDKTQGCSGLQKQHLAELINDQGAQVDQDIDWGRLENDFDGDFTTMYLKLVWNNLKKRVPNSKTWTIPERVDYITTKLMWRK